MYGACHDRSSGLHSAVHRRTEDMLTYCWYMLPTEGAVWPLRELLPAPHGSLNVLSTAGGCSRSESIIQDGATITCAPGGEKMS